MQVELLKDCSEVSRIAKEIGAPQNERKSAFALVFSFDDDSLVNALTNHQGPARVVSHRSQTQGRRCMRKLGALLGLARE